jgi:hypothetical protein
VAKERLGGRDGGGGCLGGGKVKKKICEKIIPLRAETRLQGGFLLKKNKNLFEKVLTKPKKYRIIKLKKGGE